MKKNLTYEDILALPEIDEAKKVFQNRLENDLDELFIEMVEHETKYKTFEKSTREEITPQMRYLLDIFNKAKYIDKEEYKKKIKLFALVEERTKINVIDEAMCAKFASDYFRKKS